MITARTLFRTNKDLVVSERNGRGFILGRNEFSVMRNFAQVKNSRLQLTGHEGNIFAVGAPTSRLPFRGASSAALKAVRGSFLSTRLWLY